MATQEDSISKNPESSWERGQRRDTAQVLGCPQPEPVLLSLDCQTQSVCLSLAALRKDAGIPWKWEREESSLTAAMLPRGWQAPALGEGAAQQTPGKTKEQNLDGDSALARSDCT